MSDVVLTLLSAAVGASGAVLAQLAAARSAHKREIRTAAEGRERWEVEQWRLADERFLAEKKTLYAGTLVDLQVLIRDLDDYRRRAVPFGPEDLAVRADALEARRGPMTIMAPDEVQAAFQSVRLELHGTVEALRWDPTADVDRPYTDAVVAMTALESAMRGDILPRLPGTPGLPGAEARTPALE